MRVLLENRWREGMLDYHRRSGDVRIDVRVWIALQAIDDQYFERSRDWRRVWQYVKRLGPRVVFRKIRSRLAERGRNRKYLSVGVGSVLEAPPGSELEPGELALFLAYDHPRCVDRISIDSRFALPWDHTAALPEADELLFLTGERVGVPEALTDYRAWSPHSGRPVDAVAVRAGLEKVSRKVAALLESAGEDDGRRLPKRPRRRTAESTRASEHGDRSRNGMKAVLFGLGNYAKTAILPNLPLELRVDCIHELDPLQIGDPGRWDADLNTSPDLRNSECYDVYFLAGYHHTHAPLAVDGMERGGVAVVEKPVATELQQLERFRETVRSTDRRFFVCFHKRYAPYTEWAQSDLPSGPVHYHCQVYEEKLPAHHWYRWPCSGSRVLSNGCHWIDHFMFLNNYEPVRSQTARRYASGAVFVAIELANDAAFSMVLTDHGSGRLGVRDHVELRSGEVTVTIRDSARYVAEDARSVVRKKRANPGRTYRTMYRQIGEDILSGQPGDSLESLRSSRVALELDRMLDA